MRATSAAEASSMRASCSTEAVAPSPPVLSVLASIRLHLLFVAMVPEPARQKPLAPFLLEHLVHEAMILGRVPGETVQHETAALQREGPLPHFPQLVVVLALRLHDGNLVNGGIVQTDVTINGPDRGLGRLGIRDIKAHRARFE